MGPPAALEPKGKPFTVRLTPAVERWIVHEATRTKRSKSTVLEGLAQEAIRSRRFPGIAFRGPAHDRRAWLVGTALDVWEVIEAIQAMGQERLLADGGLSEGQLRLAMSYYREDPAGIDQAIADNQRPE